MFEDQRKRLELELPEPSKPGASYVPYVQSGNLVFLTGQLPQRNGERRYLGKLGREFTLDEGWSAARLCALDVIVQLRVALDRDWARLVQFVRIAGFVNSMPDFVAHSQVINGASDVFLELFGDKGRHFRVVVAVSALPYNAAVEVEAIVKIR
jgi:enamine deaminase RidA (YjgF/YER057c/UK114 family)